MLLMYTQQNAGPMLAHRLRRWANISPALGQRVVFDGLVLSVKSELLITRST